MRVLDLGLLALTLALAPAPALAAEPVLGAWRVVSMDGQPLVEGGPITFRFADDGRLTGQACNRFGASYRLDGQKLAIAAPMATRMACAPPIMEQEHRLFALLGEVTSFHLDGASLTLTGASGATLHAARGE